MNHSGQKPYVRKHCKKSFTEYGGLNKNILIHTAKQKSQKNTKKCKKSFTQPFNLKTHILTHMGQNPH